MRQWRLHGGRRYDDVRGGLVLREVLDVHGVSVGVVAVQQAGPPGRAEGDVARPGGLLEEGADAEREVVHLVALQGAAGLLVGLVPRHDASLHLGA